MDQMEITISTIKARVPITVMHVKGNVDSDTHSQFQAIADEVIRLGARYVIVDLSETSFMSSAGLNVLHNLFNQLRSANNDLDDDGLRRKIAAGGYKSPYLKVANLQSQVRDAFIISGFNAYIDMVDDVNKAAAAF
jgi:anti-anti-sigma factor